MKIGGRTVLGRLVWFVPFMGLGSIAISISVVRELQGRRPLMQPAAGQGRTG